MDETNLHVTTTKKSFDIIEHLVQNESSGVSEVARSLEIPKSTVYEHLSTLEELEFVVKDQSGYRPSTKFLQYGGHTRNAMELFTDAKPELHELAETTGEHVCMVIEEHGQGVILYTAEGKGPDQLVTTAGTRTQLHTNASGKAILTHLPDERVRRIVENSGMQQMTENTITDPGKLLEELERVRERGYATNYEERLKGMKAVAAPVLDRQDSVLAAIAAYGPARRIDDTRLKKDLPGRVLETANVVEVTYNY